MPIGHAGTPMPRRAFMGRSAGTAALAAAALQARLSTVAYAGGTDTIKLGLVGCGGRGTGAAVNALRADPSVRLVAMADVFADKIEKSYENLAKGMGSDSEDATPTSPQLSQQLDVPAERRFVGFDAYRQAIDEVDAVILTETPHFRPRSLAYAVERGVHVFAEKPVATDAPGVRACMAACEQAASKNVSIVSGLCWRYDQPRRRTIDQIRAGRIGLPVAIQTVYNSGGVSDPKWTREQCQSDMEYQLRNWYYYTWLSGDHIVEQAVHGLDTMAWVMRDEPPLHCWGVGGRQVRTDPRFGNIYDHFSLVYEYPNDVRGYHMCRHWRGVENLVNDMVIGTAGTCDVFRHVIRGCDNWRDQGVSTDKDKYQAEHDTWIASIRAGKPVNDGLHMCRSTMLAIMGRMAAYTGGKVTWDEAWNSTEKLGPEVYEWGDVPEPVVAVPGVL